MRYHTPDNIWTAFSGVTDFESYAGKFVVKGRFHKDVPPEVVEGYAIAEHIMAHAYYRYPAMDEALVKLLRVLEMAVKMRCKELGITLETLDNKGKARKKVLNTLINELAAKEAAKPTKGTLIWLKDVRNYLMHPSETSLLGSVAVGHIRQCVIMLNALFLPERYFEDAKTELERVRSICQPFGEGLFVLEHMGHRYIVYRSEFVETYFVEGEWLVLCAFHAVPADLKVMATEGRYPPPLVYRVKGLQIGDGKISGTDTDSGLPFVLAPTDHTNNKTMLERFEQEKSELDAHQKTVFQVSTNSTIGSAVTKSRYEYWGSQ
ncbi:MAG TPA: hypothetical protein PK228_16965 [Saprospiraceae bacterium]|nr:hypothetical protein [Saprospiraceae bacterium]